MARELTAAELKSEFRKRLSLFTAMPYSARGDVVEVAMRDVINALQHLENATEFSDPHYRIACTVQDEGEGDHWIA